MEWKRAIIKKDNNIEIPTRWLHLHYYEALTILFRIENALRVFVFSVLKNEFQEKWCDLSIISDDSEEGTIKSIARRRINQAKTFGYLGYPTTCPIMYLTGGELIRLITSDSYWKYFNKYFLGSKNIIRNKLDEIGNIRNALSHFRPIKQDDVDLVKANSKHVLVAIEKCISEMLDCRNVVPTNTTEDWYKKLKTLGTDNCTVSFLQSNDEQWIKINIKYNCPIIFKNILTKKYIQYKALNILPSAILTKYPLLSNLLTYLSESIPSFYSEMDEDYLPDFSKDITLVFSRKILSENHEEIKSQIEQLLLKISEETELISQDNLAMGEIIKSIYTSAYLVEMEELTYWKFDTNEFLCNIKEGDPPEFWGDFHLFGHDFIAGTYKYPWMSPTIAKKELPF